MLSGDKNDRIVGAGSPDRVRAGADGDIGQNQRLGINLAVERGVVELAEISRIDVRRRQLGLGQVGPRRLRVNVVLRDIRREQASILESLSQRPSRRTFASEMTVAGRSPSRCPHAISLAMNQAAS